MAESTPLFASVLSPLPFGTAKSWKLGLCECGSTTASAKLSWLMALLCPCAPLAQIASRFSGLGAYYVVLWLGIILHVAMAATVLAVCEVKQAHWPAFVDFETVPLYFVQVHDLPIYCWGTWALLVAYLRFYGRAKMHLAGNFAGDFVVSCCCSSCTIAQLATQVDVYGPSVRRDDCSQYYFGPRDVLPPYVVALEPRKSIKHASARTVVV